MNATSNMTEKTSDLRLRIEDREGSSRPVLVERGPVATQLLEMPSIRRTTDAMHAFGLRFTRGRVAGETQAFVLPGDPAYALMALSGLGGSQVHRRWHMPVSMEGGAVIIRRPSGDLPKHDRNDLGESVFMQLRTAMSLAEGEAREFSGRIAVNLVHLLQGELAGLIDDPAQGAGHERMIMQGVFDDLPGIGDFISMRARITGNEHRKLQAMGCYPNLADPSEIPQGNSQTPGYRYIRQGDQLLCLRLGDLAAGGRQRDVAFRSWA